MTIPSRPYPEHAAPTAVASFVTSNATTSRILTRRNYVTVNGVSWSRRKSKQLWLDLALDVDGAEGLDFGILEKSIASLESHSVVFVFEEVFATVIHDELRRFFVRLEGELVGDESESNYRFVTEKVRG